MKRVLSLALSSAISLAALALPVTAMAATPSATPFQVKLSGATEVPGNPEPVDGILSGENCAPNVHDFINAQFFPNGEPAHIVFAVQATPEAQSPNAVTEDYIANHTTVNVLIYGIDGKLLETLNLPSTVGQKIPIPGTDLPRVDSHTGNWFFVECVWLNDVMAAATGQKLLQPGDYSYKFQATITDTNGKTHTRTWVPENNTFTITQAQ